MAVFTALPRWALRDVAEAFALGRIQVCEGVAGGTENSTYRLRCDTGIFALTLVESQGHGEVIPRLRLMIRLHRAGLPVPPLRRTRDGGILATILDRPAVVLPWVEGEVVHHPTPVHCLAVGTLLARLHGAKGGIEGLPPWPASPAQPSWPREVASDHRRIIEREWRHQRAMTAQWERLPRGPLHADLFRDNLLFRGSDPVGLIDFHAACHGPRLYDLAMAAVDWCRGQDDRLHPARLAALIRGYQRLRPWTEEESWAWPHMLRRAALDVYLGRSAVHHRSPRLGCMRNPAPLRNLLRHLQRLDAPHFSRRKQKASRFRLA